MIPRDKLLEVSWDLFLLVLYHPATYHALWAHLLAALLMAILVVSKFHAIGNAGRSSLFIGTFVVLVAGFGLLETAALIKLYGLPLVANEDIHLAVWISSSAAAFLLFVVPFTRVCFQAGYFTSLGAWVCAALVAGLAIFGVRTVYSPKPESPEQSVRHFDTFARQLDKDVDREVRKRLEQLKEQD